MGPDPAEESSRASATATNYVNLASLNIATPEDWSNDPTHLAIERHFAPSRAVPTKITKLGYTKVLPVITDREDTYFIQATKSGKDSWFIWNSISGRLAHIEETWALKEVMNMVGISVLNIKTKLVAST